MLEPEELATVADAFGVSEAQVQRDHFISHILAAIAASESQVTFFGGTALARTHLADSVEGARLSEDIDLYTDQRGHVASILDRELPALLRREFPGAVWDPSISEVRSVDSGQLVSREGLRVRVQLLDSGNHHLHLARFPTETREVLLRYSDLAGAVTMRVPTIQSFAAMKLMAWMDRHTARDLYDLAGLARLGALDQTSAELVREASGLSVRSHFFTKEPKDWAAQLAHQTGGLISASQCLSTVRSALSVALEWDTDGDS
jgi:predicted nucleotidyltransferase component of viral defense system